MTILGKKQMSEEDIKLNFITPAIQRGWKGHITMETRITDGRINIRGNIVARSKPKFADYLLSLNDGKPTLKNCLDALIIKYGKEIFNKELSSSQYNQFLNVLVNSRVNIMHVKRNQRKPALNGKQSCLYAQKLSLLYRKIIFELLQINESLYLEKLKHCVLNLDNWNSISDDFLSWLSK